MGVLNKEVVTLDAIFSRRSIRRYTSEPVPEEIVTKLLHAAMCAPSARNERPWHFVVMTDREILDEIPKFHPYSQMVKEASVAILVCGDLELEKSSGYLAQDCAAATQNILLEAHFLGLGSVWCGVYPREERMDGFRRLLQLPDHIVPFALVPVGYPAEERPQVERFDPTRIHKNRW